jgi:hypothetical protein
VWLQERTTTKSLWLLVSQLQNPSIGFGSSKQSMIYPCRLNKAFLRVKTARVCRGRPTFAPAENELGSASMITSYASYASSGEAFWAGLALRPSFVFKELHICQCGRDFFCATNLSRLDSTKRYLETQRVTPKLLEERMGCADRYITGTHCVIGSDDGGHRYHRMFLSGSLLVVV